MRGPYSTCQELERECVRFGEHVSGMRKANQAWRCVLASFVTTGSRFPALVLVTIRSCGRSLPPFPILCDNRGVTANCRAKSTPVAFLHFRARGGHCRHHVCCVLGRSSRFERSLPGANLPRRPDARRQRRLRKREPELSRAASSAAVCGDLWQRSGQSCPDASDPGIAPRPGAGSQAGRVR